MDNPKLTHNPFISKIYDHHSEIVRSLFIYFSPENHNYSTRFFGYTKEELEDE
jgi:hypothetical protein